MEGLKVIILQLGFRGLSTSTTSMMVTDVSAEKMWLLTMNYWSCAYQWPSPTFHVSTKGKGTFLFSYCPFLPTTLRLSGLFLASGSFQTGSYPGYRITDLTILLTSMKPFQVKMNFLEVQSLTDVQIPLSHSHMHIFKGLGCTLHGKCSTYLARSWSMLSAFYSMLFYDNLQTNHMTKPLETRLKYWGQKSGIGTPEELTMLRRDIYCAKIKS